MHTLQAITDPSTHVHMRSSAATYVLMRTRATRTPGAHVLVGTHTHTQTHTHTSARTGILAKRAPLHRQGRPPPRALCRGSARGGGSQGKPRQRLRRGLAHRSCRPQTLAANTAGTRGRCVLCVFVCVCVCARARSLHLFWGRSRQASIGRAGALQQAEQGWDEWIRPQRPVKALCNLLNAAGALNVGLNARNWIPCAPSCIELGP